MADDVLPWTKEEQDQEDDVGKQTKDDEQDSVPLRSPPEPSQIEPYTPEEKEGGIDEAASVESPVIPSLPVQTALHISADVELTLGNWNAGGTSEQRMKPEILPRDFFSSPDVLAFCEMCESNKNTVAMSSPNKRLLLRVREGTTE